MHLPAPITSRTNAKVKVLRTSLSGGARRAGDLLGLEGFNLIREAHFAGMNFDTVYLRDGSHAGRDANLMEQLRANYWAVLAPDVFDSTVSTATPQGMAATWVIQQPKEPWKQNSVKLVIENLQDPGNLGTLLRSAWSFGVGNIMVTPETANHWNPKVVRSAAGATFYVQVQRQPLAEIMETLHASGTRTFAAVSGFLSGPEYGYPRMAARHGVLTGRMDNAAAPADYRYPEHPFDSFEGQQNRYAASLSYDTDFLDPCAILIGNEGTGLSEQARRLADEQVLIPGSAESLNAGVAGSVLMYEAMRQRVLRLWATKQGLRP